MSYKPKTDKYIKKITQRKENHTKLVHNKGGKNHKEVV